MTPASHAVLYAGHAIDDFVYFGELAIANGHIYLVTFDSTVYAVDLGE